MWHPLGAHLLVGHKIQRQTLTKSNQRLFVFSLQIFISECPSGSFLRILRHLGACAGRDLMMLSACYTLEFVLSPFPYALS